MKAFLLLLGLVLLGGLLFFFVLPVVGTERGTAGGAAAPGTAAPTAPAPGTPRAELEAAPAREETADEPAPRREALAAPEDERFGAWDTGTGGAWVEGHVAFPAGAPADSGLTVLSLSAKLEPRELYGVRGLAERLVAGERDDLPDTLLGRAPVREDGSFRVPVPEDRPTGWLAVTGRFLYSSECQAFDLRTDLPVRLTPALGALLTGRVLFPEGEDRPEVHAGVRARLRPDVEQFMNVGMDRTELFARDARVFEDGRFELRAVDVRRPYLLGVESDHLAGTTVEGIDLEAGRETSLEVRLLRGATVRGLVRDTDGAPLADVEVAAVAAGMMGFAGRDLVDTRSRTDGTFVLDRIPPGSAALRAKRDGYLESTLTKLELADEEERAGVELVLELGSSLAGTVRWPDGRAAAGAKIEVDFDMSALVGMNAFNAARGAKGETVAGEDGGFLVTGLGRGPFVLVATDTPEGDSEPWEARRKGLEPNTEGLELELAPRPRITGTVVDEAGAPVEEFTISAELATAMPFGGNGARKEDFESADGSFVLGKLEVGSWKVSADAPGYGRSEPVAIELTTEPGAPLRFVLVPAARISGTVVDSFGEPVSGASVTLAVEAPRNIARMTGQLDLPKDQSGEAGEFLLEDVTPGHVLVVASHTEHAESERVAADVAPGQELAGLVLKLRVGGRLTGEVYGPNGRPVAEAQVIVQNPRTFDAILRRTDPEGLFEVAPITPGTWSVTAVLGDPGSAAGSGDAPDMGAMMENMRFASAEIADGEEVHVVLGAPPADPVVVEGHVTHAGEPLGGAVVSFFPSGGGMDRMKFDSSAEDGSYRVELAEPGEYHVQVQSVGSGSGLEQQSVEFSEKIPKGERHRLELELPVGRILGRVLDEDGEPIAGARVTLTTSGGMAYGTLLGGNYAETSTKSDGGYEFRFLGPGTYAVAAGGSLFGGAMGSSSPHGRQVRDGLSVDEGESLDGVDFRLEPAGEISGVVKDAGGKPVANATIFVRDEAGLLLERFSMQASEEDGSFRYTGIAPGRYTVIARTAELVNAEQEVVTVRSGETASVTLTVDVGTILIVTVTDDGEEDVEARITIEDSRGRTFGGMVSYAEILQNLGAGLTPGEHRFGPLPADRYVVTARTADGREKRKPVDLSGMTERRLKIRLR